MRDLLTRRLLYGCAYLMSFVVLVFAYKQRRDICKNLHVVCPDRVVTMKDVYCVFLNFTKNLIDFSLLSSFDQAWQERFVDVEGEEHLVEAQKLGKGVLLAAAHIGNWDMGCLWVSGRGYPLHTVFWTHKQGWINRYFVHQRRRRHIQMISYGRKTAAHCLKVLRKGECIALAVDRNYGDTGKEVLFFNHRVCLPHGVALLSCRTGAPVVPTFCVRQPHGRYKLIFGPSRTYHDTHQDKELHVSKVFQDIVTTVEGYIRKHADQWAMFHDVFVH